jgi:hypothetical protein
MDPQMNKDHPHKDTSLKASLSILCVEKQEYVNSFPKKPAVETIVYCWFLPIFSFHPMKSDRQDYCRAA